MYPPLLSANLATMATVSKCQQGEASPHNNDLHHRPVEQSHMVSAVLTRDQASSMIEGTVVEV